MVDPSPSKPIRPQNEAPGDEYISWRFGGDSTGLQQKPI